KAAWAIHIQTWLGSLRRRSLPLQIIIAANRPKCVRFCMGPVDPPVMETCESQLEANRMVCTPRTQSCLPKVRRIQELTAETQRSLRLRREDPDLFAPATGTKIGNRFHTVSMVRGSHPASARGYNATLSNKDFRTLTKNLLRPNRNDLSLTQ